MTQSLMLAGARIVTPQDGVEGALGGEGGQSVARPRSGWQA